MTNETNQAPDRETSRATTRSSAPLALPIVLILGGLGGGAGVYLAMRASPPHTADDAGGPAAQRAAGADGHATASAPRKAVYRCPMHPAITSDHPGVCPICGMTLVLDAATDEHEQPTADDAPTPRGGGTGKPGGGVQGAATGAAAGVARPGAPPVDGLATVSIDPARQQMIGLRTTRATRSTMATVWRTVGRVEVDPTRVRRVNVKVESYVERVFVDFVGKPVRKGQPLMSVYSPSLLAAEEEYLLAVRTRDRLTAAGMPGSSGDDLVAASRRKLELWDVPAEAIAQLAQTGIAAKNLTFVSPISGVVTTKNVVEGATLRPGDTPYEITDLSMVWVMADAYESDITRVRVGMRATLTLGAYPSRVFEGRVEFVDPMVDPGSRTAKVHLHFANPAGALKPEMFGEIVFRAGPRQALRVPSDAIIRTGEKDVVFVALGAGKFAPHEVRIGASDGEFVEIASGLEEGQEVVTRANFLVDSESRLRASLASLAGK